MRKRAIMTRTPLLLAIVAAAALAGCESEPIIVGGPPDDPANQAPVANGPVELPPSIVASHAYRCRDNSLFYIDWLSNDTARIKPDRGPSGVTVTKGEDGAYAAEGQRLTGDPAASSITGNGKSCKR
jgi:hypothetical protein